jgi:ParB-like chromosome segregation protein Spo0J
LQLDVSPKKLGKVLKFSKSHGYYRPVTLSGNMSLIAGAATFGACLENKEAHVPAVVIQTDGDAENILIALQSATLDEAPNAVAVSTAIVQLIDKHGVTRKNISQALGKSRAWLNKMENLSRKLNTEVQRLVTEGQISPRAAQEIALLPDEAQTPFAISACNDFLNKQNVAYLVSRFLNEDTGAEERDRIIHTPKLALPNGLKSRPRTGRDNSDSARLSRAVAICLDDVSYLSRLLDRIDIDETAIRMSDMTALSDALAALGIQICGLFTRVKSK